jgi:hypothetical protein
LSRWGRLSQPDISPAVCQLGPSTHKRLVAGRPSPLQGDKRLSISTCVTSESCHEQTLTLQCHLRFAGRIEAGLKRPVACARTSRWCRRGRRPQNQTQAFHWVTDRQGLHAATIKSRYARHTHVRTVPPAPLGMTRQRAERERINAKQRERRARRREMKRPVLCATCGAARTPASAFELSRRADGAW